MSWDWDAEDIDPDEDDGSTWVPITPQHINEEAEMHETNTQELIWEKNDLPIQKIKETRTMSIYPVSNGPGGVRQGSMPVKQVVALPIMHQGSARENDEESQTREQSSLRASSREKVTTRREEVKKTSFGGTVSRRKICIAKNAPTVTSGTPREIPCDRCHKTRRPCLPRTKGGHPLSACGGCFGLRMACKTSPRAATGGKAGTGIEPERGPERDIKEMGDFHELTQAREASGRPARTVRQAAVRARVEIEKHCWSLIMNRDLR